MDESKEITNRPIDSRVALYRALRMLVLVFLIGAFLRVTFLETGVIRTDQMSPALLPGDRVLVMKQFSTQLPEAKTAPIGSPFIFRHHSFPQGRGCLRAVAFAGDTVEVSDGILHVNGKVWDGHAGTRKPEVLPAQYSPRDNLIPFVLPEKGDTVSFGELTLRDMAFASSLLRRQKPDNDYSFRPRLYIEGKLAGDYIIENFSLYNGSLDSVPPEHFSDWFFWDRLREYLRSQMPEKSVDLRLELEENGHAIPGFVVVDNAVFLIADDWESGFDSRHFGPVVESDLIGRPSVVLWSFGEDSLEQGFRSDRVCKLVR